MAEEDEVTMEVEAAEAVYGDDCIYPSDPPYVDIIGSKGLDEKRQKHLISGLHEKAHELASCLMLVALCEEAVEILTSMNHPEGDCPLCLYPLVTEDKHSEAQPFMKLMSCFHCFHCECIVRWLKWFLRQNDACHGTSKLRKMMGDSTGNCPVCRKVFLAKDIEHVLNLVGSHDAELDVYEKELVEKVLQCDLETSRRQKFETILELQQQHGGLIEPPKDNVLFSRLSLQDLVSEDAEVMNEQASEQQHNNQIAREEPESSNSSNRTRETRKQRPRGHNNAMEPASGGPPTRSNAGHRRYSGPRKHNNNNSRWQAKPCPKKE
uniref:E3 ubiquitin-protein ligase RNF25 n=1 Tax=Chenopodium quinoa TaxID=63459 RepID=A0A803LIF1_CHEQI